LSDDFLNPLDFPGLARCNAIVSSDSTLPWHHGKAVGVAQGATGQVRYVPGVSCAFAQSPRVRDSAAAEIPSDTAGWATHPAFSTGRHPSCLAKTRMHRPRVAPLIVNRSIEDCSEAIGRETQWRGCSMQCAAVARMLQSSQR